MAYTQKLPLSERPPKRPPYERCYGGRTTPIIKFRDPNEPPRVKHQNSSGRIRRDKTKPIICEVCGRQIPETEIKLQRLNRKFHRTCNPRTPTSKGFPRDSRDKRMPKHLKVKWKDIKGEEFINRFDEEFELKPIEIKEELK